MQPISDEERRRLMKAVRDHEFLRRIVRRIESLLRVVFQAEHLDPAFVRAAAEEILVADILTRHHGNIDGVYYALRKAEDTSRSWDQALADYAAYAHNYFTTPLGVVIRRHLYGSNCHFVTPAAGPLSPLYKPPAA